MTNEPWPDPCPDCGSRVFAHCLGALGLAGEVDLYCSSCSWHLSLPAETTARSRIVALREIVRNHSARRIDGYLVDATTANLLVNLYDALSPARREQFGKPELGRLVDLAWRVATPS